MGHDLWKRGFSETDSNRVTRQFSEKRFFAPVTIRRINKLVLVLTIGPRDSVVVLAQNALQQRRDCRHRSICGAERRL